jgi:polyisoprenoid-binding protein YceI
MTRSLLALFTVGSRTAFSPPSAGAVVALALVTLAPAVAAADAWEIDPAHSVAAFTVRHMMVSNVRGEFGKLAGTVAYDPKAPARSAIEATIDATTVNTREEKRDTHLKSPDFFDVAQFPSITFKSTRVDAAGKGKLKITGDLTIHGVTKSVVLSVEGPTPPAKDPWGNERVGASAVTKISRKDFGLVWNKALESGGVLVSDEVQITLDVELVKKK